MADEKISQLTPAVSVSGTDATVIVQGGANKSATVAQIAAAIPNGAIDDAMIALDATIQLLKLERLTPRTVVVTDVNGILTDSIVTVNELSFLSGKPSFIETARDAVLNTTALNAGATLIPAPGSGFRIVLDRFSFNATSSVVGANLQLGDTTNPAFIFNQTAAIFTSGFYYTDSSNGNSNMPAAALTENEPLVLKSASTISAGALKTVVQYRIVRV